MIGEIRRDRKDQFEKDDDYDFGTGYLPYERLQTGFWIDGSRDGFLQIAGMNRERTIESRAAKE
jgi:hypothetical protein